MKKLKTESIALLLILLFSSCHLEDFNLNNLSTTDIAPTFYAPMAYGTFKVGDYVPPIGSDNQLVTAPEVDLRTFNWNKGEFSFKDNVVDSVIMDVTFTNGTPMKMQVEFSFSNYSTGTTLGKTFNSGILSQGTVDASGKVVTPSVTNRKFSLDSNDLETIKTTDGLKCLVKLTQSGDPVIVKNLKESEIKIQINIKANVRLGKLN